MTHLIKEWIDIHEIKERILTYALNCNIIQNQVKSKNKNNYNTTRLLFWLRIYFLISYKLHMTIFYFPHTVPVDT